MPPKKGIKFKVTKPAPKKKMAPKATAQPKKTIPFKVTGKRVGIKITTEEDVTPKGKKIYFTKFTDADDSSNVIYVGHGFKDARAKDLKKLKAKMTGKKWLKKVNESNAQQKKSMLTFLKSNLDKHTDRTITTNRRAAIADAVQDIQNEEEAFLKTEKGKEVVKARAEKARTEAKATNFLADIERKGKVARKFAKKTMDEAEVLFSPPGLPSPEPKSASPSPATKAVATMYGLGRVNAIKIQLENLTKKLLEDMKKREKVIPKQTIKDYTIEEDSDGIRLNSKFGDENLKQQKKIQDLQQEWASLRGITDPDLQRFLGSFNTKVARAAKRLMKKENEKKSELVQQIFAERRAKLTPTKPTKDEAGEFLRIMRRGEAAFERWATSNDRRKAIVEWINTHTNEFRNEFM